MARYLFEANLTAQAVDALIKNPHDRAEGIGPMIEAMGGKLDAYYFAAGQGTIYVIYHLPDEVSLEALSMVVLAGGAVTSFKTTPVLTSAEAVEAMKKAATILYKPPSA